MNWMKGAPRGSMAKAPRELDLALCRRAAQTCTARNLRRAARALSSLYDDLAKSGREPSTVVRSLRITPASLGIAAELGIAEGDDVCHIERVRYADGEPLAIMTNSLPSSVVKLDRESLEKHGLYNLLRAAGSEPRIATQVIGARIATAADARSLQQRRGAAFSTQPLGSVRRRSPGSAGTL